MTERFEPQFGMVCASLPPLQRTVEYGLQRTELVLIAPEEIPPVREFILANNLLLGFHAPAFRREDFPFRPLLCGLVDPDVERRELSLDLWEDNLRTAQEWGARYMVAHIQRPMQLLGEQPDADFGEAEALAIGIETGKRLAELSDRYGVPVFIENSVANPSFCQAEAYVALCEAVPSLRLCLDIGHLFLDAAKYGLDAVQFARTVAPYVGTFHVYGNIVDDDFEFSDLPARQALRKHPPHPSQDVAEGWLDNETILREVLSRQPEALVTFEVHYSMDVDREHTREGLEWARRVCLEARGG